MGETSLTAREWDENWERVYVLDLDTHEAEMMSVEELMAMLDCETLEELEDALSWQPYEVFKTCHDLYDYAELDLGLEGEELEKIFQLCGYEHS